MQHFAIPTMVYMPSIFVIGVMRGPDGKALAEHTGIKMYAGAFDVYGQKTQKRKL